MDKYLEQKARELAKSMYKKLKKKTKKDVVEDLFDSNNQAETNVDEVAPGKGAAMKLSEKMQKKQGVPKEADPAVHERCVKKVKAKGHDKSSAYAICNEAGAGQNKKSENFVEQLIDNFRIISDVYIKKQENTANKPSIRDFGFKLSTPPQPKQNTQTPPSTNLQHKQNTQTPPSTNTLAEKINWGGKYKKTEDLEKAKIDEKIEGGKVATKKRKTREERNKDYKPHEKTSKERAQMYSEEGERLTEFNPADKEKKQKKLKQKLKDKTKIPSKEDLEYPMSASEDRCWEKYEPTPGKKPYSEGSCQKKTK